MPHRIYSDQTWGYIKISFDKKYLIASYHGEKQIEVCKFNAFNGYAEYLYTLTEHGELPLTNTGIEFSPDSKYLYVSYNQADNSNVIYQYDMDLIENEELFYDTKTLVGTGSAFGLQLARDGKIYCSHHPTYPFYYVSVINKPWIYGDGCMFESNAINMYPGEVGWSFPNILIDYLLRFEWSGEKCQGYPIHFKPNFIPTPDSIIWNFDDQLAPGSLTNELSPTYAFQHPGVHEVKVDVWYPTGRFEHTSREIEIYPSPHPDLGPDTTICQGNSLTVAANCTADLFSWSTGAFGSPEINVTDSGTYWVRASFNETGCQGYDTIHVGFYPRILINETSQIVTPTSCNGETGSITGLVIEGTEPFQYQWNDLSGNDYGTNIDATGLPAGQYQIAITDGNDCASVSDVYTIEDAGNLQVLDVELIQPHCVRPDGQIVVHGFSPSASTFEFSIDDGASYSSDSVFTGLSAGNYVIRIRDINGREGFYLANPVILADIPGPQVSQVNVTNETDGLGNGIIEIIATGNTSQFFFSIDSGNTFQANDGSFENVICNMYYVVIKDENGCDTSFTVEVQNVILTTYTPSPGREDIAWAIRLWSRLMSTTLTQ